MIQELENAIIALVYADQINKASAYKMIKRLLPEKTSLKIKIVPGYYNKESLSLNLVLVRAGNLELWNGPDSTGHFMQVYNNYQA
jgi:hypothetical protein